MDVPLEEKAFQMKEFKVKALQQNENLQKISQHILPNVMKLLGQHQAVHKSVSLPTISPIYISPLSTFTLLYNIAYILLFYMIQIQLPLIITFGQSFVETQFINDGLSIFYWFMFGFFLADMLVDLHKGFYEHEKGKICDDRNKIMINYLKRQVYFDLLSVGFLVLPRVSQNSNLNYLLLIPILFSWVKKFKYAKEIIQILQYKRTLRILFTLTTLFLDVLLQGHYVACIFTKIDLVLWSQQYYGNNTAYYWLSNNNNYGVNLMPGPWYDQYVYAQSFSTGTLSTLAPGPFVKNPIQVCFALFIMIYFMLFASYIAQILINVMYSQEEKRFFHEQNIQDFDKYMILKNISEQLKTRIYNFFELIYDVESRLQSSEKKQVINLLPMNLKEQLLIEMSFVKNFFMLNYVNDPVRVEKLLAIKINRLIVDSETCLFRQASLIKKKEQQPGLTLGYIYFLSRGIVKYYITMESLSEQTKFRRQTFLNFQPQQQLSKQRTDGFSDQRKEFILSLSNNDKFIGLYEFITKRSLQYCCKAIDLCEVDTISRKDFMEVLKITQNQQIYFQLKHQLLAENNLQMAHKVCSICFQNHTEERCPTVNVKEGIKKKMLEEQGNYGRKQSRKPIPTTKIRLKNTRNNLKSSKIYKVKNSKQQQIKQDAIKVFSSFFTSSKLSLDEILINTARVDETEQMSIWKNYYPDQNVDRLNFMTGGKKQR